MPDLDDNIMIAMREARRHHLLFWLERLEEHKNHAGFRVETWPYSLEYGFVCGCSGVDQEYRIRVHSLREALPEARQSVMNLFRHHANRGNKTKKKVQHRASVRAKALLHKYLTREQRISLRGQRSFNVIGADGRQYEITEGSCNNILTEWQGHKLSLCVIHRDYAWLPIYDLMLTQKVLLETQPEAILNIAVTYDKTEDMVYQSARFLLDGGDPVPSYRRNQDRVLRVTVPDEALENPTEFMRDQMGELTAVEVVSEAQDVERIETRSTE